MTVKGLDIHLQQEIDMYLVTELQDLAVVPPIVTDHDQDHLLASTAGAAKDQDLHLVVMNLEEMPILHVIVDQDHHHLIVRLEIISQQMTDMRAAERDHLQQG